MTAPEAAPTQRPGATAGALARCVGDAQRFLDEHWGRRSHLHRGVDVDGLLGADDVDHILGSMALRAPAFRVVKGGATLPSSSYTRRARIGSRTVTDLIDVGRVYGHFADGATIVLQGLHRYWAPVTELCQRLEAELTHPLQANAYITPPVAQGLRVHADAHDVFAVQTHGRKQWVLYEGDQRPAPDGSGGSPTLDVELWTGDCLYVPKGCHHAARTVDSPSIHLTLGIKTLTWADVLRRAVDAAVEAAGDEPLPAGFADRPDELSAEARRRLDDVAERVRGADAESLVAASARRFWSGRIPALEGQLQQLLRAGDVDDRTLVRRRPHVSATMTRHGDLVEVSLADRLLRMPAAAEPALRTILDRDYLRVGELGDHLDHDGRIALVQRLVREGLLLVVDG